MQIENYIRFGIASGKLKPGDQLPPTRALSEQLGVNFNTVAIAYRDLEVMGYLLSHCGKGIFIKPSCQAKCRRDCAELILKQLHEVIAEAKAASIGGTKIQGAVKKSPTLHKSAGLVRMGF